MFNELNKNLTDEEKLTKFIERKSSENKALKKLLQELQKENDEKSKNNSIKK